MRRLLVLLICGVLGPACSDSSDGAVVDCAEQKDFTPCKTDSASSDPDGVCLAESCRARTACGTSGCDKQGPGFPLADTNVRECFGPSPKGTDGRISCPGKAGSAACGATAHCGQDGQYGWDVEHGKTTRFTVSTTKPGEPVVTDTVTGLVWQRCSAGQTGDQCTGSATMMDWFKANTLCEQATWGGISDWQLPNTHQLHSMLDFGTTSPAVDLTVFVNTPSKFSADYDQWWKECYWSSSSYANDTSVAWVAMVNSGDISEGSGTNYHLNDKQAKGWDGCYVRCVRGAGEPVKWRRFVSLDRAAAQPVVADTVTRLLWQGCSAGQKGSACSGDASMISWKDSLAHCEKLTWAGQSDWRLPNVKELRSLVDTGKRSPALDAAMFPNTPFYGVGNTAKNIGQYWSSTARWYNDFALYVEFRSGFSHFYKQTEGRHVRCVRDP